MRKRDAVDKTPLEFVRLLRSFYRTGDQVFRRGRQWYFRTRERNRGPFETLAAAVQELKRYIDTMEFIEENKPSLPPEIDCSDVTLVDVEKADPGRPKKANHSFRSGIGGTVATEFHAVSIKRGPDACDAVKAIHDARFLSREAPRLPLPDCMSGHCRCTYEHFHDRRDGGRRDSEIGLPSATPSVNRRRNRGRRTTDRSAATLVHRRRARI